MQATLEQDLPLRQLQLDEEEEKLIRDFNFLTRKPLIVVINADEEQMRSSYPQKDELKKIWHRRVFHSADFQPN